MTSLQHAMNIGGFTFHTFRASDIKRGFTVTEIDWRGGMATHRIEVDVGDVVDHWAFNGVGGVIVRFDRRGIRWEPYAHFRKVNDELEVWA